MLALLAAFDAYVRRVLAAQWSATSRIAATNQPMTSLSSNARVYAISRASLLDA